MRVHHAQAAPPEMPDRAALAEVIDRVLGETLDEADSGYWVIRRLALPFRAEPSFGLSGLMDAFACRLRDAMRRVLAGEIVDGVRRYDSRAHWLAACIRAQASDAAAHQWRFSRYRELAALPPGDAVRLTLEREPRDALAALGLLAEGGQIRPLCARIGERAARGVLRGVLPARAGADALPDALLQRLLHEEVAAAPRAPHGAMLAAVARYAQARLLAPLPRFRILAQAVAAIPVPPGPSATGATWQGAPDPSPEVPRFDHSGEIRNITGKEANAASDTSPEPPLADDGARLETGFAGVFALWRSVLEMGLLSLLPDGAEGGPDRLALAATLAGPEHAAAWRDPALHWLCGYRPEGADAPPPPPPDLGARFARHFAEWRAPRRVEPTISRIGRVTLLRDRATGDWLALGDRRRCLAAQRALAAPLRDAAPGMRDPSIDLDWFGVRHRKARRAWALLARAAYGDFARRLHGLEGASAAWLWDRLLTGWGALYPGAPAIMALPRADLDLVLRMGGLDGAVIETAGGPVRLQLPGAG
ncbi:hypothetical protein [Roseovarius spongiae]|nr:hypothetical protein [Roseovarius spongiae]